MSLAGKVALVTGASRGIGAAIADELGRQGAKTVGTATSEQGADKITQRFKQQNIDGYGIILNVNDPDGISDALKTMQEKEGAPDILVNNAGITRDNLILRMKEDEWSDIIETNLTAIFRLSKTFLKPMIKKRWGRIISISSVVGTTGNPGQANYAAAKAGMLGFSKSLAQEIAVRNVTVNVVSPGFIDTEMTQCLNEQQREAILSHVPMQRLGRPEDIAKTVAFLASDDAAYITGETIHVNGGLYMS